jgi:hypothetical protein
MGINNFRDFGLIVIATRPGIDSPPYKCDKEESSGGSEPVPALGPQHGGHARLGAEIRANFLPEQGGRMFIQV